MLMTVLNADKKHGHQAAGRTEGTEGTEEVKDNRRTRSAYNGRLNAHAPRGANTVTGAPGAALRRGV